ncbi:MAG: D-glutamate cyclase family protein [Betaproteobacteria bacterium]
MIDVSVDQPARRARLAIREGRHTGSSRGLAMGYVQCNLVILPRPYAFDFLLYCQRNPRACPVLEVTDPGNPEPQRIAPGADLRTDLARYTVWRNGQREDDRPDIGSLWRDDLVAFLIGSGITFDLALERAGVPTDRDRWVLNTTLPTEPAGPFAGPLVVTMRWLTPEQAIIATQVSARFPFNHGAPIHIGDPAAIGADLARPLFGPPVDRVPAGRIAVFWACGVTPQAAAENARPELMIAHAPAHSFITDLLADRFCQP